MLAAIGEAGCVGPGWCQVLVPTVVAVLAATLISTIGTWLVYRLTQGLSPSALDGNSVGGKSFRPR